MLYFLSLVVQLLLLLLSSYGSTVPEYEIYALKALYDSTDGPNWAWMDVAEGEIWNFTGNISILDPCYWQGVDCTCASSRDHYFSYYYFFYDFYYDDDDSALATSCNIRKVYLDGYDLDGVLPDDFFNNLPNLTHLHLGVNYLYSTIPASIANLTMLEVLYLAGNSLEGTLDNLSYLVNLEVLSLYGNFFYGNTSMMERMTNLLYLDLGYNYLDMGDSGNLITMFSTNLHILWLNDNLFSGVLDYFLPRLTALELLGVHRNSFQGNISSVAHLSQVKLLNLFRNSFTGDLTPIANLHDLQVLRLYYCNFTGNLEPLTQLHNLISFDIESNQLTGSIEPLRHLTKLGKLHLSMNYLSTQSLEPLSNLTLLYHVGLWNVYGNAFTGPVDIFQNFPNIEYLDCDNNQLTGDITALGSLVYADNLYFSSNLLSGTLDGLANLTALKRLDVHDNLLHGTVDAFDNIYTLQFLRLSSNNFYGTVPSVISLSEELTYLNIADNHFEGTVPSLQSSQFLTGLFLARNMLSGPLDFITLSPNNTFSLLSVIDISSNMFSGYFPNAWFRMENIANIIAALNCLKISFTNDVCEASQLQALLLDGLHSNAGCRYTYSVQIVDEIYYSPEVVSNIPSCIYDLPSIQALHVSGNGLKTRLPSNVLLNNSLTDLVMSNNQISGPIPPSFQRHHFDVLDLSYNKITGLLSGDLSVTESFNVQTNRLSGSIPKSLYTTSSVNMLSGNIYSCDTADVSKLHDSYVGNNYTCGSDAFTYSGIVCFVLIFIILVLIALSYTPQETVSLTRLRSVVTALRNKRIQLTRECNISEELDNGDIDISISKDIHYFMNISDDIKKFAAMLTTIIVLIYLPIYCGLSAYYGRYTYAYVWTASAAYLSGVAPGAILFILYLLMVLIPGAIYSDQMVSVIVNSSKSTVENVFKDIVMTKRRVTDRKTMALSAENRMDSFRFTTAPSSHGMFTFESTRQIHDQPQAIDTSIKLDMRSSTNPEDKRKKLITLTIIALVNFMVVGFINGAYVYLSLNLSGIGETIIEFLMGAFKSVWTSTVLLRIIDYASRHGYLPSSGSDKSRHLNFLTVIVIVNNILLPCLALSVISPDCFYNRLYALNDVSSTYTFDICRVYDDYSSDSVSCIRHMKEVGFGTITYSPAYSYRYQCSSMLVVSYVPVYIYSAIFTGLINPLIDIGSIRFFIYAEKHPSTFTTALADGLKRLQVFAEYIFDSDLGEDVFNQTNFILTINASISILATFGVIFPFLGFIVFLSIIAVCLYQQYRIGKYIHNLCKSHHLVAARISKLIGDARPSTRPSPSTNDFDLETVFEDKNGNDLRPSATASSIVEYRLTKIKELNGCFSSVENRLIKSVWNLLPYISIFYSLFVFDTIGDEVGDTDALWGPILLIVLINVIYTYPFVIHFYKNKVERKWNRPSGSSGDKTNEVQMGAIYKEEDSHQSNFDSMSAFARTHNPLHPSSK